MPRDKTLTVIPDFDVWQEDLHRSYDGRFRNPNPSGIEPTGFRVLVRDDAVEEKTKGGIFLPDDSQEKQKFAQQSGVLIAVSPAAFNYDEAIKSQAPQVGARVLYAKYAGFLRKGSDGVEYRIIEDKDVVAVLV